MSDTDECPFCGSDLQSVVKNRYYGRYEDYHVMCQECGSCGPTAENEQEAVKKWNERANIKE